MENDKVPHAEAPAQPLADPEGEARRRRVHDLWIEFSGFLNELVGDERMAGHLPRLARYIAEIDMVYGGVGEGPEREAMYATVRVLTGIHVPSRSSLVQ